MINEPVVKAPLNWLVGGLLLGLVQILAVAVHKPLGVSTQFAVVDSVAIHKAAPEYADSHPLIGKAEYRRAGYGFWLDVGLIFGAAVAAASVRMLKARTTTVWWRANHGRSPAARLSVCFVAGFLILMGARLAHGCTSGTFASGWAQLSLSALPFTLAMFGFGMAAARITYPKTPEIGR